jgi:hypothetical protein
MHAGDSFKPAVAQCTYAVQQTMMVMHAEDSLKPAGQVCCAADYRGMYSSLLNLSAVS